MKKLLFVLAAMVASVSSYRILAFFPITGKSHHFVFRPIMEEMAQRGHEVVYVTGFDYENVPKGIKQISIKKYIPEFRSIVPISLIELGEKSILLSLFGFFEMVLGMAPYFVGNPQVKELIHSNENFDAIMFESYFVQEYQSAFIHKFNAVGIEVMPLGDYAWTNELSGLPDNTAYQLDVKNEHTNTLDFWGRLYNTYVTLASTLIGYYYLYRQQALMDKYFDYPGWESRPPLSSLVSNRSLILTNSHFAVGYPAPLAPHRKEIGGINVRPNKPLPKDLQKYMDESKHGVIYMSLGSNVNVSDVAVGSVLEAFMSVFEKLPQNVLMKWETEYTGKLPSNVKLSKWFPQQDILGHKKCSLFITHGGHMSITEATHFGVPLVGIPIFGDQARNLILVEEAGYGRMLRYRNISRETFFWTINEVLNNKRYKEEAVRRSNIIRDRRFSPAEEAAYWIEYAIKYPNVLTPKGAQLSFVQLHLIDLHLFLGALLLTAIYLSYNLLMFLIGLCKSDRFKKETEKKLQ